MKKVLFLLFFLTLGTLTTQAQQFKIVTVIESIVPGGIGRSRIIETKTEVDASEFTTERTDGKRSDQGDVRRRDLKVDEFEETKLLNFYSLTGINFQNIASNDALIVSKLAELSSKGWEIFHVTSGVESDAGETDGNGIFITRFYFMRK